jgi:signal transduction histidine kinase/ligand-binding sensor domain-containing protein
LRTLFLFLALAFTAFFNDIDAQVSNSSLLTEQPFFQRVSNYDGLSQGTINCIIQDQQGFMWFGTMDGLNRYDGYEITVFRNLPGDTNSISSNVVNQIIEDKAGLLWFFTDNGINVYNPVLNTFKRIHLTTSIKPFKVEIIHAAVIDASGKFWLGTQDNGLICYNPESGEQKQYFSTPDKADGLISNSIRSILADSKGKIWLSYNLGGMSILDPSSGNFTNYPEIPGISNHPAVLYVNAFAETPEYKILIGLQNSSVISFDPVANDFKRISLPNHQGSNDAVTIRAFAGSNNILWIATDGAGLISINTLNEDYSNYTQGSSENSLAYNTIKSLYFDRDNNLWIGTYGKGINILSPYLKAFYSFVQSRSNQFGLSFSSIRSIFEDENGVIWVGGYNDLNNIDLNKGTRMIQENIVTYSLCQDPSDKNIIWIGTEGAGLQKFNKTTRELLKFPITITYDENTVVGTGIYEITPDNNEFIYFGSELGLNVLNKKTGKFRFFANNPSDSTSIVPGQIMAIFIDSNHDIWVGSMQGGLARFNKENGTFTRFLPTPERPGSLSGIRVNCIFEDAKKQFWIGTNMGLNLMDRETGKFKVYTETDGLVNNFIYGILDDKHGNLWLSTNKGISKFNPEMNTFSNFNIKDGLPGNEFNTGAFFKKSNERLYFGGVDGLVVFNPDRIVNNPVPPKVVFTNITISNQKLVSDTVPSYLKQITLKPDDLLVEFEFSALNFINPENCQYAYQVENLSEEWISLGNKRTLMLTHLAPGEYFLKIKASNNDGVWNENPATLKIIVLPKFYETLWFKLLLVFVVLAGIFTITLIRFRLINHQKKRLQKLVDERTQELKDAVEDLAEEIKERRKTAEELQEANTTKDKFFSIIAHDLRSPFNTLIGFSDLLVDQWPNLDETDKLEFIKRIKKTSENTFNLVDNLLEWSRLQKGTIEFNPLKCNVKFLSKISIDQLQADAELKEIKINTHIPGFLNVFADQNMIDFVFRNLISNAIKFTPRNGNIFVRAKTHDNRIICQVEDTGIGMEQDTFENLFKLGSSKSSPGTEGETGTGLGLILCKEFIKKSRGSIWVESEPGKGSKFFFSLPVSEHY